uniref:Uncharacterized protein n=1 Tax=Haptolina brevifila TaxID=156173 RepID=A0A7S2CQ03_9EUKA|mmetsp:Transcript_27585/g.55532  ORF Transcript_27585/g.55532 Transcript_27585/m.55532 type:complete len:104 (+) Transcript_27585:1-312(+)
MAYAAASAAVLTLASLTSLLYTADDYSPVLRPEVGDTVRMVRQGVSGKVIELVDATKAQALKQKEEMAAAAKAAATTQTGHAYLHLLQATGGASRGLVTMMTP